MGRAQPTILGWFSWRWELKTAQRLQLSALCMKILTLLPRMKHETTPVWQTGRQRLWRLLGRQHRMCPLRKRWQWPRGGILRYRRPKRVAHHHWGSVIKALKGKLLWQPEVRPVQQQSGPLFQISPLLSSYSSDIRAYLLTDGASAMENLSKHQPLWNR